MFRPREQQRAGDVREPHVQHKHESCWGESGALRPQPQHYLHHGLMPAARLSTRARRQLVFILRHNVEADFLTLCWFAAKMQFCSKHKAHFRQQLKMLQISAFITWNMEEGGRVYTPSQILSFCTLWVPAPYWQIDQIEYFMLNNIKTEGLFHNTK